MNLVSASIADYALDTLKKTKVAIIADTSGYGTSSAKTACPLSLWRGLG